MVLKNYFIEFKIDFARKEMKNMKVNDIYGFWIIIYLYQW